LLRSTFKDFWLYFFYFDASDKVRFIFYFNFGALQTDLVNSLLPLLSLPSDFYLLDFYLLDFYNIGSDNNDANCNAP